MSDFLEQFVKRLSAKRRATREDLAQYESIGENRFALRIGDTLVKLDALTEDDELDMEEKRLSSEDNPFWNEDDNRIECDVVPDTVDHRGEQTSIKAQLDRGTCVCFASLACLEAHAKRSGVAGELDLSEQYANWLFMRFLARDQCDDGLRTTLSARFLSTKGVCEEQYAPYEDFATVSTHCTADPSAEAKANAVYGIGTYTIIERLGYLGPSIANTDYLECVLSRGLDVVFGTHVAWGLPDPNGVYDVVLDPYGNPLSSRGGHAMLIVGYVKNAPEPYFILKNSWGPERGVNGYYYLSHDYVRQYAKYGYIVHSLRTDMPTE
jgi:hypothetical protein